MRIIIAIAADLTSVRVYDLSYLTDAATSIIGCGDGRCDVAHCHAAAVTPFKGGEGPLRSVLRAGGEGVNILSADAGARADRDDERVTTTTQEFNLQGESCIFSSLKFPGRKGER